MVVCRRARARDWHWRSHVQIRLVLASRAVLHLCVSHSHSTSASASVSQDAAPGVRRVGSCSGRAPATARCATRASTCATTTASGALRHCLLPSTLSLHHLSVSLRVAELRVEALAATSDLPHRATRAYCVTACRVPSSCLRGIPPESASLLIVDNSYSRSPCEYVPVSVPVARHRSSTPPPLPLPSTITSTSISQPPALPLPLPHFPLRNASPSPSPVRHSIVLSTSLAHESLLTSFVH